MWGSGFVADGFGTRAKDLGIKHRIWGLGVYKDGLRLRLWIRAYDSGLSSWVNFPCRN